VIYFRLAIAQERASAALVALTCLSLSFLPQNVGIIRRYCIRRYCGILTPPIWMTGSIERITEAARGHRHVRVERVLALEFGIEFVWVGCSV
jgi:hypothetical protein